MEAGTRAGTGIDDIDDCRLLVVLDQQAGAIAQLPCSFLCQSARSVPATNFATNFATVMLRLILDWNVQHLPLMCTCTGMSS